MTELAKKESDKAWQVLGIPIFSAVALMIAALVVQIENYANVTAVVSLATALVGFAGGAAAVIFGKSIAQTEW